MTKEIPALRNEERGLFYLGLLTLIRERTCNPV